MSHAAGKQTKNAPLNFEPKNVNFWPIKFQPKFAFTQILKSRTHCTHTLSLSLSLSLFCSFLCSKIFSEVKRRGNDDECDLYVLARYFCGGVFARKRESIRKGRKMMRENHHHHHHRRSCIGNENFTDRDFRRLCSSSSSSSRRGGKGKGAEERRRRRFVADGVFFVPVVFFFAAKKVLRFNRGRVGDFSPSSGQICHGR